MRHAMSCLLLFCLFSSCASEALAVPPAPAADHHQHLFSPDTVALLGPGSVTPLAARDLLALLDAAGIRRALLLSTAYMLGKPDRQVGDERLRVQRENDWTAAQAAQFPDRLVAFCGIAPLKDYALDEIRRCAGQPGLKRGIKFHLGNSDVQLENPVHAARLAEVFAQANAQRMAIVVHLRANIGKRRPYGAAQARAFLDKVLPAAPDVPVQIAHMGGTGPGFDDPPAREVLAVLAEAVAHRVPATRNLWFDVASVVDRDITPQARAELARRIRQIGPERILFGSNSAQGDNLRPREAWQAFLRLPLTDDEFTRIASNVAPYLVAEAPAPGSGQAPPD